MPDVTIDLARLDANIHRFHQAAATAGIRVRAHVKAHRTLELASRQVAAGAVGAAVHTAHAARLLADAGVTDVVVAWPWAEAWRFPHYAQAASRIPRFAVHVDRPDTVVGVGAAAVDLRTEVGVLVDLRHAPDGAAADLAKLATRTAGVRFDGVTSYSAAATTEDIRDRYGLGRRHARRLVEAAETIRAAGIDCPVVSVGGTPTAPGARDVAGVTEICAGAYATMDGGLAQAGVCRPEDVALSVDAGAADLLAGCGQPWAPEVTSLPAAPPGTGRLVPAHICPLAVTLVRRGLEITVVAGDRTVRRWRPFAAPDRE